MFAYRILDPYVCVQNSGFATRQTLQLARRKCLAKGYSDDQKNDFGERWLLFRRCFIINLSSCVRNVCCEFDIA